MKRFLIDTIIILVLLAITGISVDYGLSKYLQHSNNRMYTGWNTILHEKMDADLIILGSSRAWVHYDPHILDSMLLLNSYNLGIDGGHFAIIYLRYCMYSQYQKLPKCIVLNIDYLFGLSTEECFEREQIFPYLVYPNWRRQVSMILPMSTWSNSELYIPDYRYLHSGGILHFLLNSNHEELPLYKGFLGQDLVWDGNLFRKYEKFTANYDERVLGLLETFLAQTNEDSIKVVFCVSPTYIGVTEKTVNQKEIEGIYRDLSQKYDIPLLDYSYSSISMDSTNFYNATHLNRYGAQLFSTQLALDLDSLGILSYE